MWIMSDLPVEMDVCVCLIICVFVGRFLKCLITGNSVGLELSKTRMKLNYKGRTAVFDLHL